MKLRRSKHEWGLWSRPQERFAKDAIQTRTCQRCGAVDTRTVRKTSIMGVGQDLETEVPNAALDELNVR